MSANMVYGSWFMVSCSRSVGVLEVLFVLWRGIPAILIFVIAVAGLNRCLFYIREGQAC